MGVDRKVKETDGDREERVRRKEERKKMQEKDAIRKE